MIVCDFVVNFNQLNRVKAKFEVLTKGKWVLVWLSKNLCQKNPKDV